MKVRVLGSAAGGGFPQWNCGCANCSEVRRGSARARPRMQESVAISSDGRDWFLLNASPEIRQQIESFAPLHPRGPRDSPIAGLLLTNGDLDHSLGLLSLRESTPLAIYATEPVRRGFTEGNALYRTLERFPGQTCWHALTLGARIPLLRASGSDSGLWVEPVPIPGKLPIHLEASHTPSAGDNVGLLIDEPSRRRTLAYFPAVSAETAALRAALGRADCVFFDGTFWSSDELIALGLGEKRAEDMAHWPVGGARGSLSLLASLGRARRILVHINNTNPMLLEDSPQARAIREVGVEIAHDGMEFEL